jgi:hypothetical protein
VLCSLAQYEGDIPEELRRLCKAVECFRLGTRCVHSDTDSTRLKTISAIGSTTSTCGRGCASGTFTHSLKSGRYPSWVERLAYFPRSSRCFCQVAELIQNKGKIMSKRSVVGYALALLLTVTVVLPGCSPRQGTTGKVGTAVAGPFDDAALLRFVVQGPPSWRAREAFLADPANNRHHLQGTYGGAYDHSNSAGEPLEQTLREEVEGLW